jgi:Transposase DDE domain group 1
VYSLETIRRVEKRGLTYAISAALNAPLRQAIHEIEESAWEEGVDEDGHRYSIARIHCCPTTWGKKGEQKRTYVISRRLKKDAAQGRMAHGDKYRYFASVTKYRAPLLTQFRVSTERCSLESFIKEGKGAFQYDFLPCKERDANEAYLSFVQLCYNLAILFKLRTAPNGVNRWTMKTLRERVLCICGNLRRRGTHWWLSLPAWWPYQTVFRQMERRGRLAFGQ